MLPQQTAITGRETVADPRAPEHALTAFYRAFNGRDLAAMTENWSPSGEASMDNPLGGIKRGWDDIRAVYERLFLGPARVYVEFHDYTLHRGEDWFLAVGRERGSFTLGDTVIALAVRTSRFYRMEEGRWRQLHHHGSIEDPALLERYRRVVFGRTGDEQ